MQKAIKLIICVSAVLTLSGCAGAKYNQNHYQQYVGSISPMVVPQGVALKKGEQYYQVPRVVSSAPSGPVSLIPPGSKVLQYRHSKNLKNNPSQSSLNTKWSYDKKGIASLKLPVTTDVAWEKLGQALQETPYKVLDKDSTMKSIYVLDTESTGNSITQNTPIYRLFVEKIGRKQSKIALTDRNNQPTNPAVAQRILGTLKKDIS